MFRHTRNADTMPDIGYPVEMISGMPAATAPAEIDAATADQLRRILHVHEGGPWLLPGGASGCAVEGGRWPFPQGNAKHPKGERHPAH